MHCSLVGKAGNRLTVVKAGGCFLQSFNGEDAKGGILHCAACVEPSCGGGSSKDREKPVKRNTRKEEEDLPTSVGIRPTGVVSYERNRKTKKKSKKKH